MRFEGEDEDSELDGMKRDLQSSADLLDQSRKDEDEYDELRSEMDDLKYRIRRVKDDIEYNKSGRRTEAKEQEQRRLERELLFLQHERLPDLEDRLRNKERQKRSEDRTAARKRDALNRPDRLRFVDSPQVDADTSGSDQQERPAQVQVDPMGSKPTVPQTAVAQTPSAASLPVLHASSDTLPQAAPAVERRAQTAEERQAFIRAEAQRRVQERMRALTGQAISVPAASQTSQSTVYERSEEDKKAAAERSLAEDKAADERAKLRQQRLEEERTKSLAQQQEKLDAQKAALQKVSDEVTVSELRNPNATQGEATQAAREQLRQVEEEVHTQEKYLQAELKRQEAQNGHTPPPPAPKSTSAASRKPKGPPPKPPASRSSGVRYIKADDQSAPSIAPVAKQKSTAQEIPTHTAVEPSLSGETANEQTGTALPSSSAPPASYELSSKNPFHRMKQSTPITATEIQQRPATGASKNPFFRAQGAPLVPSAPSATPLAAPVPKAVPSQPPKADEDWDDIKDLHGSGDDSSEDEDSGASVQQKRAGLAGLLFGGGSSAPPSRPSSARPESGQRENSQDARPATVASPAAASAIKL